MSEPLVSVLAQVTEATSDGVVPRHVALVMDGNGRWARKRFMPRFFGHKQGVDALVKAVNTFADRGVEYLTVFAFSSENWKRPTEEVSGLLKVRPALKAFRASLQRPARKKSTRCNP